MYINVRQEDSNLSPLIPFHNLIPAPTSVLILDNRFHS